MFDYMAIVETFVVVFAGILAIHYLGHWAKS